MLQLLDYRLRVSPPALEALVQQLIAAVPDVDKSIDGDSAPEAAPITASVESGETSQTVCKEESPSVEQVSAGTEISTEVKTAAPSFAAVAEAGVPTRNPVPAAAPVSQPAAGVTSVPGGKVSSAPPVVRVGRQTAGASFAAVVAATQPEQKQQPADGAVVCEQPRATGTDRHVRMNHSSSYAADPQRMVATVASHLAEAIRVC